MIIGQISKYTDMDLRPFYSSRQQLSSILRCGDVYLVRDINSPIWMTPRRILKEPRPLRICLGTIQVGCDSHWSKR